MFHAALAGVGIAATGVAAVQRGRAAPPRDQSTATLLVTNSAARHVSFVSPAAGVLAQVEVGAAPWGIALAPATGPAETRGCAYVSTAEGVAVVQTADESQRERVALVPYRDQAALMPPRFGEYRPGGMGIAVSPDGALVYVGVYLANGPSRLDVLDAERLEVIGSVAIGVRPFEVLAGTAANGMPEAFAIDHDSYTVTVVDATDPTRPRARALPAAPMGRSAFDKPHYGVVRPTDGRLLLPYQGRVLFVLDPATGRGASFPLRSDTHQHGVALSPDERHLYVVGTGPAGGANGPPGLSIVNLEAMTEEFLRLPRPHERLAVDPDGSRVYLAGGYSFADGGWDGLTVIDLTTRAVTEVPVPARPLDVVVLPV